MCWPGRPQGFEAGGRPGCTPLEQDLEHPLTPPKVLSRSEQSHIVGPDFRPLFWQLCIPPPKVVELAWGDEELPALRDLVWIGWSLSCPPVVLSLLDRS